MADEKDRMGDKLHDAERAREDQWARQRDAELLEKIRTKATAAMHCPKCGKVLVEKSHGTLHTLACPTDDGVWIENSALEILLKNSKL
ncbi:MAG TPA: zf-TFIIB domain-containing protein [Candidatus Binataceae bacterium]|nr:zf-TFIIB domain-containing protein [Candidatus Binataceae bacterium]